MIVVVMGVCGAGKSTVGRALAGRLGCAFAEGDNFHPPENVAKMSAGEALTDADRAPWLAALANQLGTWQRAGQSGVLACSALKRAYREVLAAPAPGLRFLYLKGTPELLRARMDARRDHYMPPTLLDSQLATLEEPGLDENAVVLGIDRSPDALVDLAVQRLESVSDKGTRPAITRAQARTAAYNHVNDCVDWNDEMVLLDHATIEKPYGWIFFYQSRRYIETGDYKYQLAGNGPVVIECDTGRIVALGTAQDPEEEIRLYEESRRKT